MSTLCYSATFFPLAYPRRSYLSPARRCFFTARLCLPISSQKAKYHRELEAAIDVVERACRLCVDVKKYLFSSNGVLEKNDQTPVTIADFGVQALISLEMSRLFPSIPLVAEEDSAFLRSNNLVDSVFQVVVDKATYGDNLVQDDVLKAIDRGGKDAYLFGPKPETYWVLDPIDGTKGFVKGSNALYVVGLALVVEGQIVLGVMGCPNWHEDSSQKPIAEVQENADPVYESGMLMISHVGCGTWKRSLAEKLSISVSLNWVQCFVDGCQIAQEARFCISDSQTWESLPLSVLFNATTDAQSVGNKDILLLPTCCGSLCKYLMVASGRASVFILRAKRQTSIKVWDHAVGIICVQEAGGKVTDWKGNPLDFAADQVERRVIFPSGGVLVTNDRLHNHLLEVISSCSSVI